MKEMDIVIIERKRGAVYISVMGPALSKLMAVSRTPRDATRDLLTYSHWVGLDVLLGLCMGFFF
jgi:hypothetical protein